MSSISLPGFEVLDQLRQTSKTVTVKAVQQSLDRTVALNFLRPELASDPNEARRFLSIARVCAQIKADGLPQIYDINSHGEQPYMVMEHVEGLSVAEIVRQNGPLPIALSIRIAITVADALNHAWQQSRLVHRNLKPSEIRIDDRGTPKLTDFGRATVILPNGHLADEEEPGMVVGTPNFLSPEQVQGSSAIDCRADIYALGATLYYMITGRVPFPDSDPEAVIQKQLTEQIPHPRTFRPDLTTSASGLISRLMMKVPEDRYTDWTDAMGDMQLTLKNHPLRRRETPQKGISTVSSVVAATQDVPPAPELPMLRKVDIRGTTIIPTMPVGTPLPATPRAAPVTAAPPPPASLSPVVIAEPAAAAPAAAAAEKPKHTSAFVLTLRVALCLLLGLWFVVLGNDRLNNPLQLPLPSPLLPLDAWFGTPASPRPRVTVAEAPPAITPSAAPVAAPAPAPAPAAPAGTPAPATAAPTAATPATAAATPAAKPAAPSAQAQALPPEQLKQLADALTRGDLAGARTLLNATSSTDATRLAEYCSAVAAIADPLQLAEQTLLAAKGQELTITYMGKERKITPRSVSNGEINADFVTADGNRPVVLKTAKFTPEELLKLLPPQPETPPVHAAVCIALLKAGHKADIAAHVPYCGVLGPVFEAAAAALP